MLLRNGAQELTSSTAAVLSFSFHHHHHHHHHHTSISPMLISFSSSIRVFCSLALSFSFSPSHRHNRYHHCIRTLSLLKPPSPSHHQYHHHHHPVLSNQYTKTYRISQFCSISQCSSSSAASIEQLSSKEEEEEDERGFGVKESWDFDEEEEDVNDSVASAAKDLKKNLPSAVIEVKDLEELPEQWRRAKLAWLCKELPSHKPATTIRLLNAQRKWITQEDVKYVAVHTMRIRENETAFRVYKWMLQQRRFRFDADLATQLADYMGKERKFSKCREIFNDIINQGIVPSESTFHILTISYLSSSIQGCLEEACGIYNRMIQLGGYQPRLSLHNSLFKALVSKPGGSSKHFLKQAEFIYHNLETSGFQIPKDIYAGLIWLHSYQDKVDTERIADLRGEMQKVGFEEGKDVLVSILRAYSKEGNVEEVERTWLKLLTSDCGLPSQSFVYRMEVYARTGDPMKSLDIFKGMQEHMGSASVAAYHKIIEIMSKAQKIEIVETLMRDFVNSGLKPLTPSFIDLMQMYFTLNLHEKLEAAFHECLEKCNPNRTIYNVYLGSLVATGNLVKASEVFTQMRSSAVIGINSRSCNIILNGYLSGGENIEAEKIYDLMCQKKYDIEPMLMEKIEYVLSLTRKVVRKPISLKLSKEQREILVGLLLGGLRIGSDEARKNHALCFEFNESSRVHFVLRRHIYEQFHEWLNPLSRPTAENEDIPYQFFSMAHSYFGFYADQFWPVGGPIIPKLIHRWLSPRVLAYWYMHAGLRTTSGDILLKLKGGSHEDVERIVKTLKAKSLDCRVKRKGRVSWIGFLGSNSVWFWKLVEPYILDDLKDLLRAEAHSLETEQHINFDTDTDSDSEKVSDDSQSMDN